MILRPDIERNVGTAALRAVELLESAGFEAWVVGGCLRDWFLGRESHDVDITTSALPWEIEEVFSGYRQIETGIAHGTVTVLVEGQPLEITTYRVDGKYADHRRPEEVEFTSRLEADLARRDFTINAMAWNPKRGLADPFGGQKDLERNLLRCVGEACRRFEEDALRILRALRFCAVYGFEIEGETAAAMESERKWLGFLSAERSFSELKKTLASSGAAAVMERYGSLWQSALSEFPDVTSQTLEWMRAFGAPSTLEWMRALRAPSTLEGTRVLGAPSTLETSAAAEAPAAINISAASEVSAAARIPAETVVSERETALLRLALLLGGDLERTRRLARQAKMSRAEEAVLTETARLWNRELPREDNGWKRWIYEDGYDAVLRTVAVRKARSCGNAARAEGLLWCDESSLCRDEGSFCRDEGSLCRDEVVCRCDEAVRRIEAWRTDGECVTLAQLAIDGNTLIQRGVPEGKQIKALLERALFAVMDGEAKNESESLLMYLGL